MKQKKITGVYVMHLKGDKWTFETCCLVYVWNYSCVSADQSLSVRFESLIVGDTSIYHDVLFCRVIYCMWLSIWNEWDYLICEGYVWSTARTGPPSVQFWVAVRHQSRTDIDWWKKPATPVYVQRRYTLSFFCKTLASGLYFTGRH